MRTRKGRFGNVERRAIVQCQLNQLVDFRRLQDCPPFSRKRLSGIQLNPIGIRHISLHGIAAGFRRGGWLIIRTHGGTGRYQEKRQEKAKTLRHQKALSCEGEAGAE